ncbi:MAG: DUF7948 domain-containing protein, partial [Planctomycetota bacterium]
MYKIRLLAGLIFIVSSMTLSVHGATACSDAAAMQLPFISLEGQGDPDVMFCAILQQGTAFVTRDGLIVYSFAGKRGASSSCLVLKEEFIDARITEIRGESPADVQVCRFKGRDPSDWRTNIPAFHRIAFKAIYPGIKMELRASRKSVEKLFHVAPGNDPGAIRIRVHGADALRLGASGELVASTKWGEAAFTKPLAFQETEGGMSAVQIEYTIKGNEYGFKVGAYDYEPTLVIDPLLYSTFLGGSGMDGDFGGIDIALDTNGFLYASAITQSLDLPTTPGSFEEGFQGGTDLVVAKFSSDLKSLVACTFVGGSGEEDSNSMKLDGQGAVCMTGYTSSHDFPTTAGAYDETYNGGEMDFFVLKLDSDLSLLLASTFLGGGGKEGPYGSPLNFDADGRVYVGGSTESTDFPVTPGAFDPDYNEGVDLFLACFDAGLTTLQAATYLGGSDIETAKAITFDGSGDVFYLGSTKSEDFPVTPEAFDTTYNGGIRDICISRFD